MKTKNNGIAYQRSAYRFLAPYLLIYLVFWLWPILYSTYLTLMNTRTIPYEFRPLFNWSRILSDPMFWNAFKNTMVIILMQIPIMLFLATILAVVLASKRIRFKGFLRYAFFAPIVVGEVAYSVIFRLMFNTDLGPVNKVLEAIGMEPVRWLYDPVSAMVVIIIAITWRWTGYNAIIILAGVQSISEELYEASALDGASKIQQFIYITLPQLKPVLLFCIVLSIIGTLQLFTEPALITRGGPGSSTYTLGYYMWIQGFRTFNFGYASVIAYVLVFLAVTVSALQFKLLKYRN